MEIQILIDGESIVYLEPDTRNPVLEGGVTKRAGWILPERPLKRLAFIVLRRMFSDHSQVAAWCRTWDGPWVVDLSLSNGPVVTGFISRSAALFFEEQWVAKNVRG